MLPSKGWTSSRPREFVGAKDLAVSCGAAWKQCGFPLCVTVRILSHSADTNGREDTQTRGGRAGD